ncbi:two-component system response regulator OmpR [Opitutales bacterium ASA1]|uniref:osmolarity response regulator transcription factor OmpR n=1 Tax=Congregicoccus parvus TaxID=3081749 RepID=UPI002B30C234|nr:two-component system response regulator OmpR [Opitutales bacterium ASA1]
MVEARPHVLIVEDDARIRGLLERYLKDQGFQVTAVSDARKVSDLLADHVIQIIVLDLMLPGEDGLSLCRRIRRQGDDVPIIMLTAKVEDVDRIVGLEIGADDYVSKPFNPRELVARINAVLRRRQPASAPGAPALEAKVVTFGGCELNLGTRVLKRDGECVPLTTGEFAVLEALVTRSRRPLSRDKLMELARGREHGAFDRSMDVQISRLRRLIEPDPAKPRYLQTVWGHGYVFVPDDED